MRFDLSKHQRVNVKSFDLEELTGRDSIDAAARVTPPPTPGVPAPSGTQVAIAHKNALIAQSITHVNGEQVVRPYTAWEQWTLRTQDFVVAAYDRLNTVDRKEEEDFLSAHFGSPPATSSAA